MPTMHKMFRQSLKKAMSLKQLMYEAFIAELADRNIPITELEKEELKKRIDSDNLSGFQIKGNPEDTGDVKNIDFTDSLIKRIEKRQKTLLEKLPDIMRSTSESTSKALLKTLLKDLENGHFYTEIESEVNFQERLEEIWGEPLVLFRMLISVVTQFGEGVYKRNVKRQKPKAVNTALIRLHARGCQIALEVYHLLRAGLPNGAMARWRSLHEVTIVSLFLSNSDEETSEKYLLHENIESHRAAQQYLQYASHFRKGFISKKEINKIEMTFNALCKKYGKDYAGPHGWAAKTLGIPKPDFSQIEKSVGMDHQRPYYKMASHSVHANPKGILFKLGLLDNNIILAGPNDSGLSDPGINAALSLSLLSSNIFRVTKTVDTIVYAQLIGKLSNLVSVKFSKVHRQMAKKDK